MDNDTLIPATGEIVSIPDLSLARAPEVVLQEAQSAAAALKRVIAGKTKPVVFNGEQYLEFEDWQTCARFYGIAAKVVSTNAVDFDGVRGFEARAVALLVGTGQEVSAADAMCLNDEPNWRNKALFQLRSMAQTRACAKALRNVLAWVVVLAGYRPTPAEEMVGCHQNDKPPIQPPQRKSNGHAEPTPAADDGVLLVTGVEHKTGETNGKPWAVDVVTFSDGRSAVTFDTKIADFACRARDHQIPVEAVIEPGKKAGTFRLTELSKAAGSDDAF